MTTHILTDAEVIDYADHHSGTVAMRPGQLNPYKLGVELWRHIEERWNKGQFGADWLDCHDPEERRRWDTGAGLGREKIFEVRRTHNDVSFLDTFLTADFCRDQGFFTTKYDKRSRRWVLDSRDFAAVKQQLLTMLALRGNPRIQLVDANANGAGELLLRHENDVEEDLQLEWGQEVLGNLARIWGRPVRLATRLEGDPIVLLHDGTEMKKKKGKP